MKLLSQPLLLRHSAALPHAWLMTGHVLCAHLNSLRRRLMRPACVPQRLLCAAAMHMRFNNWLPLS